MTSIDGGESEWKVCFSTEDVDLPTGYFLGVTAATGELAGRYMHMCWNSGVLVVSLSPLYPHHR